MGQRLKAKFVHVAYKGGAQASTDLITARVDFGSFAAGSVLPLVNDGKLKSIAVIQPKRSALVPNVPTTVEQGLPGLDAGVQFLLFAPAATPKDVVALLSAELRKIVGDPALAERFAKIGFDPTPTTSEDMVAVMRKTADDWAPRHQAPQHQARLTECCHVAAPAAVIASCCCAVGCAAQASDDFYAGKTVRLIIGTTTAGDYGLYAQLMAQHIGKHIPGKPTVIVQIHAGRRRAGGAQSPGQGRRAGRHGALAAAYQHRAGRAAQSEGAVRSGTVSMDRACGERAAGGRGVAASPRSDRWRTRRNAKSSPARPA